MKSACMDQHTDGPVTGALDQGVVTLIYYAVVIALPVIIKIPYTKEGVESVHIPYIIGSRAKVHVVKQLMNEMHSQEPFCDATNQQKWWVIKI